MAVKPKILSDLLPALAQRAGVGVDQRSVLSHSGIFVGGFALALPSHLAQDTIISPLQSCSSHLPVYVCPPCPHMDYSPPCSQSAPLKLKPFLVTALLKVPQGLLSHRGENPKSLK